jgi:hypothetical protein
MCSVTKVKQLYSLLNKHFTAQMETMKASKSSAQPNAASSTSAPPPEQPPTIPPPEQPPTIAPSTVIQVAQPQGAASSTIEPLPPPPPIADVTAQYFRMHVEENFEENDTFESDGDYELNLSYAITSMDIAEVNDDIMDIA